MKKSSQEDDVARVCTWLTGREVPLEQETFPGWSPYQPNLAEGSHLEHFLFCGVLGFDAVAGQKEPNLLFLRDVAGEVFDKLKSTRDRVLPAGVSLHHLTKTALFCGGTKCSAGTANQIVIILLELGAFI